MSSVDRRTFLKHAAVMSAGAAAPAAHPWTVLDLSADSDISAQGGTVWKKAPCRMCGVGCGLLIGIQSGRAVAVKGDPDSPVSRGLACVKGYHSVQALYGRDRIRRAMVRRDGQLVEVPISEALNIVADRIRDTIARHGKNSVAMYGSAQWSISDAYVASKFFKGALGTNNIDTSARLYAASAAAGLESTFGSDGSTGCHEDLDNADIFVLWNSNLAETNPVLFSRMLERRRTSPAVKIIDLTTRTTRTSYAADHSILLAPQSELAMANAICNEIIERKWVRRRFVDNHVSFRRGRTEIGYGLSGDVIPHDVGEDSTFEESARFFAEYTAENAQALSGVPAERIRWLASVYADPARNVMSVWDAEASRNSRGTWINNSIYNIHLLLGKIASPGNGALALTNQPGGGDMIARAGASTDSLPRGSVRDAADRGRAAGIWGVPLENLDPEPSNTALSIFRALDRGDVRFLWIQATNPMVSLPNLSLYRAAAAKEDRFIVVSEAYPTATTDVADVVLPAAMWLEREGIFGSAERRLQHFERMVQPPGDAMSDAWQMIEVARRLGHGSSFPWERSAHVEQIWAEYLRFFEGAPESPPTIDELRARPGVLWPSPDGRETKWRYNTAHDPAAERAHGDFDFHGYADHRARIWLRPHEPAAESTDQSFPFSLSTGGVLEQTGTGTLTRRIPVLHRAVPRAYVELNRDDASELGVRNGDRVRLVSRRGEMEIEARIDYRSQPRRGQLFVPSFDEAHPVNRLLLDAFCPLSGQPDYSSCAVRVERLGGSSGV